MLATARIIRPWHVSRTFRDLYIHQIITSVIVGIGTIKAMLLSCGMHHSASFFAREMAHESDGKPRSDPQGRRTGASLQKFSQWHVTRGARRLPMHRP